MQQPWCSSLSLLCEGVQVIQYFERGEKIFKTAEELDHKKYSASLRYINKPVLHSCLLNKFIATFSKAS